MTAHKNIYTALASAQAGMGKVVKSAVNPAFRSKYADLSDVVEVVRPALNANGITYFSHIVDGAMRTVLVHGESETRIECDVPLIVSKQDIQAFKSATTYAKRIGLESLTGVAPDDDDGNAAAKAPPRPVETQRQSFRDSVAMDDTRARETAALTSGLQDAWLDGVKDGLPANYSPAQFYDAIAAALVDAFALKKSAKGVEAQWNRRAGLIEEMQTARPTAYADVLDAYNARMKAFLPDLPFDPDELADRLQG